MDSPRKVYAVISENPSVYEAEVKACFTLAHSVDHALDIVEPSLPDNYNVKHVLDESLTLSLLSAGKLPIPPHQELLFRCGHLMATMEKQKRALIELTTMLKDSIKENEYLQTLIDQMEKKPC